MATYNKTTLATFFQTGDVPGGSDYQNLIDSQINIVDTEEQDMAGNLSTPKLITSRLSAGNANITGSLTVANVTAASIIVGNELVTNQYILGALIANTPTGSQATTVVSAAGTSQATAATLSTMMTYILQGATDGQNTGYKLVGGTTGLIQFIGNQNSVSANLWPATGSSINGLSTNAAFGLSPNTLYTVMATTPTKYSVK